MLTFNFKIVPKDTLYYSLLDFLRLISDKFMLVRREEFSFNDETDTLLNQLSDYLIDKVYSNKWPGTELLSNKKAEIFYFEVNDVTIEFLKEYSNSLFDWIAPKLLEDLCFFRRDGSLILVSVTHEKECWINLKEEELRILTRGFPELKEILR